MLVSKTISFLRQPTGIVRIIKGYFLFPSSRPLHLAEGDCSQDIKDDHYEQLPLQLKPGGVEEGDSRTHGLHELKYGEGRRRLIFECSTKN